MNAPAAALAPAAQAAPSTADLFITVPETTLPNGTIVPAFRVSQYVCTQGADGKATVTAEGTPWVRISYLEAREASMKAGYARITESQWLAIAHDVAGQDCNWTGGKVGEGELFQGIRNWNVTCAQPGSYVSKDPTEQRWLTLSNGERICDLNGNVFQWIFDDVQGDANGLTTVIKADSPSLQAPFPPMTKGMGWRPDGERDWSGRALLRGGYWRSGGYAGAFYLGHGGPDFRYDFVGFRCTQPGL